METDKTKIQDFEDFLKDKHAEDYHGTDDDMPDAFDNWISNLDVEEWLAYGDEFKKIKKDESK